jgi:hypothetical protein
MSTLRDLSQREPQLAIRLWRLLAIIGGVATVAAVSGLVVVAASKDADTLATIALPLAILAFLIQILVFAVQAWQSSEVNAKSSAVLSEVSSKIATMETQFDTHVKDLTRYAFEGTQKTQGVATSTEGASPAPAPKPSASPADLVAQIELTTWPSDIEEAKKALAVLSQLSPFALGVFRRQLDDEFQARKVGKVPGLVSSPATVAATNELLRHELIERVDPQVLALYRSHGEGTQLRPEYRLTAEGRRVGRMLLAANDPPEGIRALLEEHGVPAGDDAVPTDVADGVTEVIPSDDADRAE